MKILFILVCALLCHFEYLGGIVRYVKRHLDARWLERLTEHERSLVKKAFLYVHAHLSASCLHRASLAPRPLQKQPGTKVHRESNVSDTV